MADSVPDTTEAFYVHETIADSASEQLPYQAFYGPYSQDAANDKAAELETRFDSKEKARTNPDGPAPAPSTRSQELAIISASEFESKADASLQEAAAEPEPEAETTAPTDPAEPAA